LSAYVQIPLNGPDQTLSATRVCCVGAGLRQVRRLCLVGSGPCSGTLHGPDQTLSLVGSGLVVSCLNSTTQTGPDPTRHVRACDQFSDKVCSVSSSTTRTHGLCLRPDPTRPTDKGRTISLRPDKVLRGCVRRPKRSVCLVWSGRVRVVEFKNDTTRPDQRQSAGRARLVEYGQTKSRPNRLCRSPCLRKSLVGPVWWTLDNI